MKKFLFSAALLCCVTGAFAADSLKAKVGHMCCGSCKSAATAGLKSQAWLDAVTIEEDIITVTAKGDQKVDVVGMMDALNKAGFPAKEIMVTGPVTLTVAHLCCGKCTSDLKTALAAVRGNTLDKDKVVIDDKAKTVTLQPVAGMTLNLASVLRQMAIAGFSASKGHVSAAAHK